MEVGNPSVPQQITRWDECERLDRALFLGRRCLRFLVFYSGMVFGTPIRTYMEIVFVAVAGVAGFVIGSGQGSLVDGLVTAVAAMAVAFIFINFT